MNSMLSTELMIAAPADDSRAARRTQPAAAWRALWTRSHCEQLVHDQLAGNGFHPFLPRLAAWTVRAGKPVRTHQPMFPGYLFLHDALDSRSYLQVVRTRGLVAVLGDRWDRLAEIPEGDIAAVARLQQVDVPVFPHPYLAAGHRVRILHGPLAGLEGMLLQHRAKKQLLVISVELLRRSVAVEVECGYVGDA
jgi:transcription antitermination factor NusG